MNTLSNRRSKRFASRRTASPHRHGGATRRRSGGLLADRRGAGLVEYVLVLGMVAVVCFAGYRSFGAGLDAKLIGQTDCIASLSCPGVTESGSASSAATAAAANEPGETTAPGAEKRQGFLGHTSDFFGGVLVDGLWGDIKGVWQLVTDLPGTVSALWDLGKMVVQGTPIIPSMMLPNPFYVPEQGENLKAAAKAVWESTREYFVNEPDRAAGQTVYMVATIVIAPLKAIKAVKAARAAKVADGVVEVADATGDAAKASRIPGGLCFVAGTPVMTAEGLRPIESIRAGDLVLSRSETTGETALRPVVQTFVTGATEIVRVELRGPDGRSEVLRTTAAHPFWVEGTGWVAAGDLTAGLATRAHDGRSLEVASLAHFAASSEEETVYNFEVAEFHTYFVGETGAWVHNDCAAQPPYTHVWVNNRGMGEHPWKLAEVLGGRVVKSGDDVIEAAKKGNGEIVFVKMKSGELRVAPKQIGHDILSGGDGAEVVAAGEAAVDVTGKGKGRYISDQSGTFFKRGEQNSRQAMETVREEFRQLGIEFDTYKPPE